jgi:cytochrome c-type biogenesis protein CcmF
VRTGLIDDVYLVLRSVPTDGSVALRVIVQPLMVWLWIGGALMAIGTALAAWPGRRRRPTDPVSAPLDGQRRRARRPEPEPEPEPEPAGVT